MPDPTVYDVFDQLDQWRHLPKYQLERRADIYFAMFLPEVLKERCGLDAEPGIIPEFPLRKCTLGIQTSRPNDSTNADYAAYSNADKKVFLVELKTDLESLDVGQISYLKKARGLEFRELVSGIIAITRSEHADKRKYVRLLELLSKLGLVEGVEDASRIASQKTLHGLPAALKKVKNNVPCTELKPKVVYMVPKDDQRIGVADCIITFEEFADVIKHSGELGERFAKSLCSWAKVKAGSVRPDGA